MKHDISIMVVDVRSAHNVGSIFRSCDGFGASLVLCGITPRPDGGSDDQRLPHVRKKAHQLIEKTALGAELTVPWTYINDPLEAIKTLKAENYHLIALEQTDSSKPLKSLDSDRNVALVVGSEVEGLPSKIIEACDDAVEIPMRGTKESFNVSVATAVALYETRREQ